MVQIDEGYNHQSSRKYKIAKIGKGKSRFHEKGQGNKSGKSLDQGVAPGNGRLAIPALPSEEQEADYGNVVISPNGAFACGAKRSRRDDGQFLREPVNADVEKASYGSAYKKNQKMKNP
jgi:hypothetical protein